ncbi:MAG: DNA-binding protein WhiA [Bacilli bacterium]|nr:DNA-binding protein WhiA [Bacilli bacterium]
MSFTKEVKEEVIKHSIEEIAKISLFSAIVSTNQIEKDKIKITTENASLARYIFSTIKEILQITPQVTVRNGYNYHKNYIYIIEIKKENSCLEKLGIKEDKLPSLFIYDDDALKRNYIKGVFLTTGSINDPKTSRYHLEFMLSNETYAIFFSNLLNDFNLGSKYIKKDNKYMVYIKEAEKIGDFLRIIETVQALLYYEDIRIYRDHKNMTNRLNNCEQANVDKIIFAAANQVEDIKIIDNIGGLTLLDDKVKGAATYRLKYPEASLIELSEIITEETGNTITKSGLNHRFRKIKELANKIRNKQI